MAAYSFLEFQLTLTGASLSVNLGAGSGAAEEGVVFEFIDDKDTMTIGADGEVMHSLHASTAGTATVHLLKTSPINKVLQGAFNAQRSSGATWAGMSMSGNHTTLGDKVHGRSVAFKKGSGITYAKDANQNEWVFNIGKLNIVLGQIATN